MKNVTLRAPFRALIVVVALALVASLAAVSPAEGKAKCKAGFARNKAGKCAKKTTKKTTTTVKRVTATTNPSASQLESDAKPKSGGTLTWLNPGSSEPGTVDADKMTLNPQLDGGVALALYDALMVTNIDGSVEPRIATSLTSSDGIVWHMTLQKNVRFTDGTPYDAAAVKFNWERVADPATASGNASAAKAIARMDVVTPTNLDITLTTANSQFARVVSDNLAAIGSPTAIRANPTAFAPKPVGAGPFTLDSWTRGSEMSLVRNEDYWDAPRPYVDKLVVKFIADCTQQVNTLLNSKDTFGQNHVCPKFGKDSRDAGLSVIAVAPSLGGLTVGFNLGRRPFSDVRARRALSLALDFKQLAQVVNLGLQQAPTQIPVPGNKWLTEGADLPTPDPQKAQQLFDQIAADTGGPVEFAFSGTPNVKDSVELFLSQLSKFKNVKARASLAPSADYSLKLNQHDFQVAVISVFGFDPVPQFVQSFASGNVRNFMSYSNPEMDKQIAVVQGSSDDTTRRQAFGEMQKLIVKDLPELFMARRNTYVAAQKAVKSLIPITIGFRWDKVWLND